jgi:hypothetical protein
MDEYYIDLQDKNGTSYGCSDKWNNELYFDDLEDAKMTAKSMLKDHIVLARVINTKNEQVVYYTQNN